ncbi:MAG: hypothetical protein ACYSSI_02785 [Planctomycetota bacterium]
MEGKIVHKDKNERKEMRDGTDNNLSGVFSIGKSEASGLRLIWVIWIFAFVLVEPVSAKFLVKPLKIELSARPGKTAQEVIELRNLETDRFRILDLRLVELEQTEEAYWRVIEAEPNKDTSNPYSCLKWIKLSANSVRIDPLGMKTVTLKIKAQPNARGFYYAGMTVQTRPSLNVSGIPVVARILVPIIFEVQSRAVLQKINLTDIGVEFQPQSGEKKATTILSMRVANEGRTYSRLTGNAKVQNLLGGYWRDITEVMYREVGILPGMNLKLKGDVGRSLPPGKYKLKGKLYVDGRRVKPIETEVSFGGDPNVTGVAADAVLELEPTSISVVTVPKARRSSVLKVRNPSDNAITVRGGVVIPQALESVALGELRGEDLVCSEWITIEPANFIVPPGRQQSIRIVVKMPESEKAHANYYSNLGLWSSYPDGQNAGVTMSLINVQNKRIEAKPLVQPMKLSIAVEEASRYAVVGRFGNVGNVHVIPRCSARILTAEGRIARRSVLTGDIGLMLPLEIRNFSGLVNFGLIPAGVYRLEAVLEYITDNGIVEQATQGITIRVSVGDNKQRIVEVIKTQGEAT